MLIEDKLNSNDIKKHRFNALDLRAGLISMSPLRQIIRKATQRYYSKFNVMRKYKVVYW